VCVFITAVPISGNRSECVFITAVGLRLKKTIAGLIERGQGTKVTMDPPMTEFDLQATLEAQQRALARNREEKLRAAATPDQQVLLAQEMQTSTEQGQCAGAETEEWIRTGLEYEERRRPLRGAQVQKQEQDIAVYAAELALAEAEALLQKGGDVRSSALAELEQKIRIALSDAEVAAARVKLLTAEMMFQENKKLMADRDAQIAAKKKEEKPNSWMMMSFICSCRNKI
jgi:hypothetical protein